MSVCRLGGRSGSVLSEGSRIGWLMGLWVRSEMQNAELSVHGDTYRYPARPPESGPDPVLIQDRNNYRVVVGTRLHKLICHSLLEA